MHKSLLRTFARNIKRPPHLDPRAPNYNFEDNKEYTKKLAEAYKQRDELTKKLDEPVREKKKTRIIKDMNSDITDYYIWREFDYEIDPKSSEVIKHVVNGKIELRPKEVLNAFGEPFKAGPEFYKATSVYVFQDSFLDTFYLYDFQSEYPQVDFFEFRKSFWESEDLHEFRISHTKYANRYKFKRLMFKMVEDVKNNPEDAYELITEKKHGKIEFYNQYGAEYKIETSPPVFRHSRKEFDKVGKSKMDYIVDKEFDMEIKPAVDITKDPDVEVIQ